MNHSRDPIAIVGMQCLYPGSGNLEAFWTNITQGNDCTSSIPPSRWKPSDYDLIPATKGGFIEGLTFFDPLEHGIMPAALKDGDPEQFLVFAVIHGALKDSFSGHSLVSGSQQTSHHYSLTNPRTEVVIGRGGYNGNTIEAAYLRMEFVAQVGELLSRLVPGNNPEILRELRSLLASGFPDGTTEMLASSIPNLTSGRVANKLDFQGPNYTIDAACASGLVATDLIMRSLRERKVDVGIAAAVHLVQKPYFWYAFELLKALSPSGKCQPFSKEANGLVIGEGIGAIVMKRLEDAEKDQDRIYAIIHEVGTASDGKGVGLLTPRKEGQVQAIRAAYQQSGLDPKSVTLLEGHGTGMPVGDQTEVQSLQEVFGGSDTPCVALGSVKSMIGHTMPAAGLAGLIKASLALYHRCLPPTRNVTESLDELKKGRIFVNTRCRPWVLPPDQPRRAGVDSFGFGGINAHAILEETRSSSSFENLTPRSSEIFFLAASDSQALFQQANDWLKHLEREPSPSLKNLCYRAFRSLEREQPTRLAIVAKDAADLSHKLRKFLDRINAKGDRSWNDDQAIAYSERPLEGKVAILFPGLAFPGLAAGYTDRLGELCLHFPEALRILNYADSFSRNIESERGYSLRHQFFPPPLSDAATLASLERELIWSKRTPLGQMMAALAGWEILTGLGIEPDVVAGFSLGEWAALVAAGVLTLDDLQDIATVWQTLGDVPEQLTGLWGMVGAGTEKVQAVLDQVPGTLAIIMDPSPSQTFFAGEAEAVRLALKKLSDEGVFVQEIPFPAIHTPLAESIVEGLRSVKASMPARLPQRRVYCGMNGQPYPQDTEVIRDWLIDSFKEPLRGKLTLRNLYFDDGVRIFVEVGIGGRSIQALKGILGDEPHEALAMDRRGESGLDQLNFLLARLFALGKKWDYGKLFRNRRCEESPKAGSNSPTHGKMLDLGHPRVRLPEPSLHRLREILGSTGSHVPAIEPSAKPAAESRSSDSAYSEIQSTMNQFLEVQRQWEESEAELLKGMLAAQESVMGAFFTPQSKPPENKPSQTKQSPSYPFLGEILSLSPGKELLARLLLDTRKHLFLGDHAFIRVPDQLKPCEERLPTLPMTFGMEIVLEAAATLVPDMTVQDCHDVEASRWIALISQQTMPLDIRAKRISSSEVEVEVRTPDQDKPALKGRVRLGHGLPAAPTPLSVARGVPFPHKASELYSIPFLFHGPRFHVITRLLDTTENSLRAEMTLPDPAEWVAGGMAESTIIDPVLADGVGQVLGYKLLLEDWVVYPLRLGRLSYHGKTPKPGSVVTLVAQFQKLDGRRVEMNADVLDGEGKVWLRFDKWQVWRILWPRELSLFSRQPRTQRVGIDWPLQHPSADCCRMMASRFGEISPEWIARYCLPKTEWDQYQKQPRFDWLLQRIALKDAVRDWLREHRGQILLHLEIEIGEDPKGNPILVAPRIDGLRLNSAALQDDAIAVAAQAQSVGVAIRAIQGNAEDAKTKAAFAALHQALSRTPETGYAIIGSGESLIQVRDSTTGKTYQVELSTEGNRVFAVAILDDEDHGRD